MNGHGELNFEAPNPAQNMVTFLVIVFILFYFLEIMEKSNINIKTIKYAPTKNDPIIGSHSSTSLFKSIHMVINKCIN